MAILYNASERASEAAAAALLRILAVSCVLPDKMLWGFIFTTQNCDVRVVVPIALEIMPPRHVRQCGHCTAAHPPAFVQIVVVGREK